MPADAAFHDAAFPQQTADQGHDNGLPAGAGLALAVILGSTIWIGIFAMLM